MGWEEYNDVVSRKYFSGGDVFGTFGAIFGAFGDVFGAAANIPIGLRSTGLGLGGRSKEIFGGLLYFNKLK